MAQHVKILGILHVIYSGLVILVGVVAMLVMGGIAGMVGLSDHSSDSVAAIPILGGIGAIIFIVLFVLALPGLIGGFGLINFKPWARILVIVLSALDLISVPIGTAIGVYGLWVLLNGETERLFQGPPPSIPAVPRV